MYEVIIPSREDWKRRPHRMADTINIFTDGSKLNNQAGRGVYSAEMGIYESFRLPDLCSVYQAEVTSTQAAMMHIDKMKPNMRVIYLFSDSQSALKALDSCVYNSKTIRECRRSLNEMAKYYKIILISVPGHKDIEDDCIADELARKGTTHTYL